MPEVLKVVGRYEILREVGRGGMARVYLARQTDLDRFVALKELGAFHQDDESFAQRFLRESRVAGSLSHPNIVTVHDYFQHEGTPYIAMEYVERGSLRPWVGNMTLAQIGGVLEGLLAGLAHAEQMDIVHRDLKPENLMVTADGRVKIADFGIAKARNKMQTGAFLTATGTTVGTPTYMAPEQAMAQEIGPWTDMYSVGVMAFEFFVGRPPFTDEAPMAVLLKHVNEEIPPAHTLNPEVHPAISRWIQRMLVKEPSGRIQSATVAWDEFEEILIGIAGPRWRREARLTGDPKRPAPGTMGGGKALTPAAFPDAGTGDGVSEQFGSSAWGTPGTGDGDAAAGAVQTPPGPATPPPSPTASPGPDTLQEHFDQPSIPTPRPGEMAVEPTGMLTFGAPASPPEPVQQTPPPQPAAPPQPAPPQPAPPQQHAPQTPPPGPGLGPAPGQLPPLTPPGHGSDDLAATMMPKSAAAAAAAQEAAARTPSGRMVVDVEAPAGAKPDAGRRRSLVPVAIVAALAVAAAGYFGGSALSGGEEAPPPVNVAPTKLVTGNSLSVKTPPSWQGLPSLPSVGIPFTGDQIAVGPVGAAAGPSVLVGKVDATNSTLLPKAFLAAIGGAPKERPAVRLNDQVQAYKYEGLRPEGSAATLTVYAVQAEDAVYNLACVAPAGTPESFATDCEAVAATMQVTSGTPLPVGPDAEYAKALSDVVGALNRSLKAGKADLGAARANRGQGNAAADIADAYKKAAKDLEAIKPNPAETDAHGRLVDTAESAQGTWRDLARAARRKNRSGYRSARTAVDRAEKNFAAALAAFKGAGYKV